MNNQVEISIWVNNSDKLVFPINPSELSMNIDSASETLNVVGLGEVSIPRTPKLATLSVSSFFWNNIQTDGRNPNDCVVFLKDWQLSKKPAQLVVKGLAHFTMRVTCESFKYERRAGEEDSIYFELGLKEYREYGAQKVDVNEDAFITNLYAMTKNRADNLEIPDEVISGSTPALTNPTNVARSLGTDPLLMYLGNEDAYDPMTGEFVEGVTLDMSGVYDTHNEEDAREYAQKLYDAKMEEAKSKLQQFLYGGIVNS